MDKSEKQRHATAFAAALGLFENERDAVGWLSSSGYGMTRPVADNKTDEGRAKNRRVEIVNPACKEKQN